MNQNPPRPHSAFATRLHDRAIISITNTQNPTAPQLEGQKGEAPKTEGDNEAFDFLQGITSIEMADITDEHCGFGTLLAPQGKILFDFFIIKTLNGYWLDCDKDHGAALFKKLRLYKLRAKIDIADISDQMAVGVFVPQTEQDSDLHNPPRSYQDPRNQSLGFRLYANLPDLEEMIKSLPDTTLSNANVYYDYCIDLGIPALGHGFASEQVFLLDVNYDLLGGVSYQKGCFVGQEVTSRMKRKGQVRKRTLCATLSQPLETSADQNLSGQNIMSDDNLIGTILSHSKSHALALIRMDRYEDRDCCVTVQASPDQVSTDQASKEQSHSLTISSPAYFPSQQ